jgi:hypothetical protein
VERGQPARMTINAVGRTLGGNNRLEGRSSARHGAREHGGAGNRGWKKRSCGGAVGRTRRLMGTAHSYSHGDLGFSLGGRRMVSVSVLLATQHASGGGGEVWDWRALTSR